MSGPKNPGALRGNRLWLLSTDRGRVVQKLYGPRYGPVRRLLTALARRKTGCGPRARRATEARMLALWTAQGFPVPRDLSATFPWLASDTVLVMEFVEATPLGNILRERLFDRGKRSETLRRFAASWCERHRKALALGEAGLVQEHGTFDHVLADGARFVTIDFEQAFRSSRPVGPAIAKEIAGYLRGLFSRTSEEVFAADLAAIVEGYADHAILRAATEEYLGAPGRRRRLVWLFDRFLRGLSGRARRKYRPLEDLAARLAPGGGTTPVPPR